jgi:hypothetical protein
LVVLSKMVAAGELVLASEYVAFGWVVVSVPEKVNGRVWVIVNVTSVRLNAEPPKSTQPLGSMSVPWALVVPLDCWVSDSALPATVPTLVRLAEDELSPEPAEQLTGVDAGLADWLKEKGPLELGIGLLSEKPRLVVQSGAPVTSPLVSATTLPATLSIVVAADAEPAPHVNAAIITTLTMTVRAKLIAAPSRVPVVANVRARCDSGNCGNPNTIAAQQAGSVP